MLDRRWHSFHVVSFPAISALRATAFACSLKSLQFNRYFAAQTQTGREKPGLSVKYPLAYPASTHPSCTPSHIKRSGLSRVECQLADNTRDSWRQHATTTCNRRLAKPYANHGLYGRQKLQIVARKQLIKVKHDKQTILQLATPLM